MNINFYRFLLAFIFVIASYGCNNETHEVTKKPAEKRIKMVSAGNEYSVLIYDNGDMFCWGANSYGQFGNGTRKDSPIPQRTNINVSYVSAAANHLMYIDKDNYLWGCGSNYNFQLGLSENEVKAVYKEPVLISEAVDFVITEDNHSFYINKGNLYAMGDNFYGQLGTKFNLDIYYPEKVAENIKFVETSFSKTIAISNNNLGTKELGNCEESFNIISSKFKSSAIGNNTIMCLAQDNILFVKGYMPDGTINTTKFAKSFEDVQAVEARDDTFFVLKRNGDLYCWGFNEKGVMGIGKKQESKKAIKVMNNIKQFSVSKNHVIALTYKGEIYAWGLNSKNQVINDTREVIYKPVKITVSK